MLNKILGKVSKKEKTPEERLAKELK